MTATSLRNLRIVLWGLVAVAALASAWLFIPGILSEGRTPDLGHGEYRLSTTDGEVFTQRSLEGQPSLVFFGFTHCPDVCPTTLAEILTWKEELGPAGEALKVWFVTVDPVRDTPELLRDYVSWVPDTTGVSGSEEDVQKAVKAFRIFARKVPLEQGGYTMDHSAHVLLFDAQGEYVRAFNYLEPADKVVEALRSFLAVPQKG